MWYLAYFDEAWTAFLAAGGYPYTEMLRAGYDVQLVHTELDWGGSLAFGDPAEIRVGVARIGTSSVTIQFEAWSGNRSVVSATTVYVVVDTDGSGPTPIPPRLRSAVGPVSPLRTE